MEIEEAQKKVNEFIQKYGGYWQPLSMLARLQEEVGELSREMNISHGDKKKKPGDKEGSLEKELGDVLFTILAIANKEGIDAAKSLIDKLREKQIWRK
ncbi:nucleotide pyrophosphohydrolase [Candidatus Pacearchaeota archaeon]|nr:nucleotide pyrophosphohydrolase [Candidatus Pacearchaeota archaeon]